jgi:3-oxoacyl-[acyl-carrier protein] reductase
MGRNRAIRYETVSNDKVAIVTGAARGIGSAIARELARQGIRVAVNYLENRDAAERTVDAIATQGGSAIAVQAAVENEEDLDRLFRTVSDKWGRLDVLVNNAGRGAAATCEQVTRKLFDETLGVNTRAALMAIQGAVQAFGDRGGSIINISSSLAEQPIAGHAVYAASKAALNALSRALAQELGPRGIRVNAVAPGATETDFLPLDDNLRGYIHSRTPLGRVGRPEDIAKVVAFLASEAAAWVTGQVIGADGGIRV